MSLWDGVVGHGAVKRGLERAVREGTVNHAYLFTGPSGVGKFMVARIFAAAILCPDDGCGACNVCRRVVEEKHPDVVVVRPAGKNIPVDVIRDMRRDAFRRPVESDAKVFIFRNAERMWEEGASTLLKVLEEPPANVVFILVTSNPAGVMPTIRSRCREVRFSLVPLVELRDLLVERKRVSPREAELVARLTGGVPGRALGWFDDPGNRALRDDAVKAARALKRADLNRTLEIAAGLNGIVRERLEGIAALYREKKREFDSGAMDADTVRQLTRELDDECKREQIKAEIKGVKEVFSNLEWWYRDILVFKEGGDEGLIANLDLAKEIEEEAEALPLLRLLECLDLLGAGKRAAEQNVPVLLNIESTLFGIQEALYA